MAGCATCNSRPRRTSWKMLLVGCYWVCLCHIIVGGSTLHDVISAAASVDGTTGGKNNNNNNNSNGTSNKKQMTGDDDMPFHWPPTLLNQHRSFSSFSGQGVQIHTSKRKPEDPDVGVLVRILRSATTTTKKAAQEKSTPSSSSTNNNGKAKASLVSSSLSSSSSTGRRHNNDIVKRLRRRRNTITGGDNNINNNDNHNQRIDGEELENPSSSSSSVVGRRGRLGEQHHRLLLPRKPRSAAAITKVLEKAPLTAQDANGHKLDQQSPSTIPLQYIIVVVSVPACIVFLFVTLFSYSFFN